MDWTAIVSVSSSAAVALTTLVVNALSKRGDRQHASTLEFEKRVWETKSTALLDLISKCEKLRSSMRESDSNERQQAAVLSMFVRSTMVLSSAELLAYAAKAVNDPAEELQRIFYRAMETEAFLMVIDLNEAQQTKESAIDELDFDKAAAARKKERELLAAVGLHSGINVPAVKRLCHQIIAEARRDLRGAQDEPLGRPPKNRLVLHWRRYRD
ncbi:hypothetical protein H7H51_03420 [Mycolicibacterium farcinogenes]|nr:hypothetical protein [Mycolicibacterium farcinogenes]